MDEADTKHNRKNESEQPCTSNESAIDSKTILQNVLDTIPVRVFWKDRNGVFLGCNRLFVKDAGKHSPEEIIGKTDFDMGWSGLAEMYRRDDKLVMETGQPKIGYEEPQTTPEGKTIWLRTSKIPLRDNSGTIYGVLGTYEDITERKRNEETLRDTEQKCRTIFEGAIESIYVHDFQGRFFDANRQGYEQLGYTKDELMERTIADVDANTDTVSEHLGTLLREGSQTFETELVRKDGSSFPVEINSQVIQYGDKTAVLGVVRDITERKQLEHSLRDLADDLEDRVRQRTIELERANRAKSEFLANMSHEIRTPMAGVMGMTDLLLNQDLPDELKADLMVIKISAVSVLTLLNDMFDLSRIEHGRFELHPEVFDIRAMIIETAEQYQHEARVKNLEYSYTLDEQLPELVFCDKNRVGQVIKNLLTNAIKFTEKGSVRLDARTLEWEKGAVRLMFTVTDSGVGIPEELQESIFMPFTQIDPTYSKRYGGMGLGLTISRTLVTLMGGDIQVRSDPGKGSTFTFTVLCGIVGEEAAPLDRAYSLTDLPSLQILLVEDNPVNRLFLKRALTSAGHTVEEAKNGFQALKKNEQGRYDLIIMDIQMPEMDGVEATRRIRSGRHGKADVPILALTAYAMKGDREKFMAEGMDGYVTKPVEFGELAGAISKALATGRSST
jgi:two-component system, sensor histidine kinase and response regulator